MERMSSPRVGRLGVLLFVLASSVSGCSAGDSDAAGGNGGSDAGSGGAATGGDVGAGGSAGETGGNDGGGDSGVAGSGGVSAVGPRQIAATDHGTCALDAQGAIVCWGLARIGNPGGWVVPGGSFVGLVGSPDSICAIRQDQSFTCFPEPLGTFDLSYIPNIKVREVAASRGVVCGIDDQGQTFCTPSGPEYALPVPAGEQFDGVSTGARFACGIRSGDGSILCWGSAGDTGTCAYSPQTGQLNAPAGSFAQISSRWYSSCAVHLDGTLACWGAGGPGADPNAMFCGLPVNFGQSIPPLGTFRLVDVSANHACGVRADGAIACWGAGEVDAGCDGTSTVFDCGQSLPPAGNFEQVAVGNLHSCAMRADRTVECWGWDGSGDGRTTPPAVFQ